MIVLSDPSFSRRLSRNPPESSSVPEESSFRASWIPPSSPAELFASSMPGNRESWKAGKSSATGSGPHVRTVGAGAGEGVPGGGVGSAAGADSSVVPGATGEAGSLSDAGFAAGAAGAGAAFPDGFSGEAVCATRPEEKTARAANSARKRLRIRCLFCMKWSSQKVPRGFPPWWRRAGFPPEDKRRNPRMPEEINKEIIFIFLLFRSFRFPSPGRWRSSGTPSSYRLPPSE